MAFKLPTQNAENKECIAWLKEGGNAIGNCVAGAGKTTMKLHIAAVFPELNILDMTYNARLKLDGRKKIEALDYKLVECHSYHAFVCKYYRPATFTDQGILEVLNEGFSSLLHKQFDMILLDEQQDMSPPLFRLIRKIMRELCIPDVQLVALGDSMQTIYQFALADPLFLEMADQIFPSERAWKRIKMNKSYRVPSVIAEFINTVVLKQQRIIPVRKGGEVHNREIDMKDLGTLDRVVDEFLDAGYTLGDIFILAGSLRNNPNLIKMANYMALKKNDPESKSKSKRIQVPTSDDQALTDALMKNKLVFGSFHQTKGLERPVVIIFNWDKSYTDMIKWDSPECPNPIYVAVTRALEHLVLLKDKKKAPLPFLATAGAPADASESKKPLKQARVQTMSVTDLMRGHDSQFLYDLGVAHLVTESKEEAKTAIPLKPEARMIMGGQKYTEGISHLYGIAVTIASEIRLSGKCGAIGVLGAKDTMRERMTKYADELKETGKLSSPHLLDLANRINCYNPHCPTYKHQVGQINHFKWVESDKFETAVDNLCKRVGTGGTYEKYVNYSHKKMTIHGFIDLLQDDTLWEIKTTSTMQLEHSIQVAIYSIMAGRPKIKLYNPLMDQEWLVTVRDPDVFLDKLVENRLKIHTQKTPEEFLVMIDELESQYVEPVETMPADMDDYFP